MAVVADIVDGCPFCPLGRVGLSSQAIAPIFTGDPVILESLQDPQTVV